MSTPIRDLDPAERERLRALNDAHAEATSPLDPQAWDALVGKAFAALALPGGFVVALDQDAAYDSPNFRWFRERYDRFVYVDRIVVAAKGQGMGRRLYGALFDAARAAGQRLIACEVNRVPPNPGSDAFHARLGFEEIGQGHPTPAKTVRYLVRSLD